MTEDKPSPVGSPEVLFGVGEAKLGSESNWQSMRPGEWAFLDGGIVSAGALGVLADDALGNAIVAGRPTGWWPVTTELSIDMTEANPRAGAMLHGESWPTRVLDDGGLAQGRIIDDSGELIAIGATRLRYIPVPDDFPHNVPDAVEPLPRTHVVTCPESTAEVLGATIGSLEDATLTFVVPPDPALANPMGNMHGGILLCASEAAGFAALSSTAHPVYTASLRIGYVRPGSTSGPMTFTAQVQHRGRTLGVAHVIGRDDAGRVCTIATVTCKSRS